jgi:hypothetical protein
MAHETGIARINKSLKKGAEPGVPAPHGFFSGILQIPSGIFPFSSIQ